ncbi:MAG: hypothetical protein IKE91_02940 [Clostridia bacterium]|nr:hypothetical protein [Clostridia bacterium]
MSKEIVGTNNTRNGNIGNEQEISNVRRLIAELQSQIVHEDEQVELCTNAYKQGTELLNDCKTYKNMLINVETEMNDTYEGNNNEPITYMDTAYEEAAKAIKLAEEYVDTMEKTLRYHEGTKREKLYTDLTNAKKKLEYLLSLK